MKTAEPPGAQQIAARRLYSLLLLGRGPDQPPHATFCASFDICK